MKDLGVRAFIEKCIAKVSDRLPAKELLEDPFLRADEEIESVNRLVRVETHSGNWKLNNFWSFKRQLSSTLTIFVHIAAISSYDSTSKEDVRYSPDETSRDFSVQCQRKDINTIFLKLRIADSTGPLVSCAYFCLCTHISGSGFC